MNATRKPAGAKWLLDALLGFFYPDCCQICGGQRATCDSGYVCEHCWQGVRFIQAPWCQRCGLPFAGEITNEFECANCRELELEFESARAAVLAEGVTLEVIHRYKYQRAMWFEPFLAGLLIRQAQPALSATEWDCIVPVPLHPLKQREREFNQAQNLAGRLSQATGIPMNARVIRRVEATRTQTRLTREQRATNVRRAFALIDEQMKLDGQRIVVIDDVLTTGATTSAVARMLRKAGASRVCVWSVARGV